MRDIKLKSYCSLSKIFNPQKEKMDQPPMIHQMAKLGKIEKGPYGESF